MNLPVPVALPKILSIGKSLNDNVGMPFVLDNTDLLSENHLKLVSERTLIDKKRNSVMDFLDTAT